MLNRRTMVAATLLVACAWYGAAKAAEGEEGKSGTVTGVVTAKDEKSITVKAEGDKEGKRYIPNWIGGNPADGGGLDKGMLEKIRSVTVGSTVKVEWKFEEHLRVIGLEVLKRAEGGDRKEVEGREHRHEKKEERRK